MILPKRSTSQRAKLAGINCTIPHKKAVIELLDGWIPPRATCIRSTRSPFRDGKAIGYNTDILGFSESLARDGVALRGKRSCCSATAARHPSWRTTVRARAHASLSPAAIWKAAALQQQIAETVPHARVAVYSRRHIPRDIQIVLNSTPVGMYPKGKSRAAALSAAQNRVCVRRDLQSAGDFDHEARQSAQDQNT